MVVLLSAAAFVVLRGECFKVLVLMRKNVEVVVEAVPSVCSHELVLSTRQIFATRRRRG